MAALTGGERAFLVGCRITGRCWQADEHGTCDLMKSHSGMFAGRDVRSNTITAIALWIVLVLEELLRLVTKEVTKLTRKKETDM